MKIKPENRNYRGITLIALVVTIVVLLILATISISTIGGENGIIAKAIEAEEKHVIAEFKERFQMDMIQVKFNNENIEESFAGILGKDNEYGIKGMYSIIIDGTADVNAEEFKMEKLNMDCIMEYKNRFYRCEIVIDKNDVYIDSIDRVKKLEQISQPLFFMLADEERFSNEVSSIDQEFEYTEEYLKIAQQVLYKSAKYNIVIEMTISEQLAQERFYIEEYVDQEIEEQKWKDVFVAEKSAYAIDNKGQLWMWKAENSGQDISTINQTNLSLNTTNIQMNEFIESNSPVIKDIEGKTYILIDEKITCLEDCFSSDININIKEVINVTGSSYNYWILDEMGDIWYLNTGNNPIEAEKMTDSFETKFQDIQSFNHNSIIALDNNGKVWNATYNNSPSEISILENQNINKIIKSNSQLNECFVITEDNQVLIYNKYKNETVNLNENNSILSEIEINEIKVQYLTEKAEEIKMQHLIDKNGDIYLLDGENVIDINSKGLCNGSPIIGVNGHTYLDEDNGIWISTVNESEEIEWNKVSTELKDKIITKQHGCMDVVMIIDSEGNLYKYGKFNWSI